MNTLLAPVTLLPGGLGALALLLAPSPEHGGPAGNLQCSLRARSAHAEVNMGASNLQKAEVTELPV